MKYLIFNNNADGVLCRLSDTKPDGWNYLEFSDSDGNVILTNKYFDLNDSYAFSRMDLFAHAFLLYNKVRGGTLGGNDTNNTLYCEGDDGIEKFLTKFYEGCANVPKEFKNAPWANQVLAVTRAVFSQICTGTSINVEHEDELGCDDPGTPLANIKKFEDEHGGPMPDLRDAAADVSVKCYNFYGVTPARSTAIFEMICKKFIFPSIEDAWCAPQR